MGGEVPMGVWEWGVCGWSRGLVSLMGLWLGRLFLGGTLVQSWVFSVLKTPHSHHGPWSLPPHFLLLFPSLPGGGGATHTGLFAILQLCRLMLPSRSLTFLFSLPGILSPPCPPHSHVTHPQLHQDHPSTHCPRTLYLTSCVFPSPVLWPYLVYPSSFVVCLPH